MPVSITHKWFYALALLLYAFPFVARAETFIVASQNIAYYPHYEFSAKQDKGYAWALLEAYASDLGITFDYVNMPVLRLQIEMEKGSVDLVYPDHPTWTNPVNDNSRKYFSAPLTKSLVGTFVKPEHYGRDINYIRKVSIVLGFSPLYWQSRIDEGKTKLLQVADNKSAIYMAEWNRSDAFDMDFYVARYLLNTLDDVSDFRLDPDLPVAVVEFCLSSMNKPELIEDISLFIKDNPALIAMLKARYNLDNPDDRLAELKASK